MVYNYILKKENKFAKFYLFSIHIMHILLKKNFIGLCTYLKKLIQLTINTKYVADPGFLLAINCKFTFFTLWGPTVYFKENYNVPWFQGGPTYSRGVQLFQGGGPIPMGTYRTCDFQGGGGSGPPVLPCGSAQESLHKWEQKYIPYVPLLDC